MTCVNKINLCWKAGNTENHILRYSDENGEAINITSGEMQIRNTVKDVSALVTKAGTVVDNLITFNFTDTETATLTPDNTRATYVYEAVITTTTGVVKTLTEGRLQVNPSVVR